MELKSKLTLAALICVGMFSAGCSQQQAVGSQQTASGQQTSCNCEPCEKATPAPTPTPAPPVRRPPPPAPAVPPVKVPQVKAKGNYKGMVQMDTESREVMEQYQR